MFGRKSDRDQPSGLDTSVSAASENSPDGNHILEILARDYLKERKSKRRWGLFFKLLVFAYLATILFLYYQSSDGLFPTPHTALVELNGIIGPSAESSDKINQSLRHAFAASDAIGVVLRINSPGGSPVQAAEINSEIRRLKIKYPEKPFIVVISDIGASGGYYVAVAADQIYANRSSLVGSIGVRMDGFGFVESMRKLGIERRLLTAGNSKGMLDPFLPVNKSEVQHAESVLRQVHQQFIEAVKQGRGERIADNADIFSGLFWSGEQAQRLGLIDKFGSIDDVAREVIGTDKIVDYTIQSSWLDQFAQQLGTSISQAFTSGNIGLK